MKRFLSSELISSIILFMVCAIPSIASADMGIEMQNSVRWDVSDTESEYYIRLDTSPKNRKLFVAQYIDIMPFITAKYHFQQSNFHRVALGVEARLHPTDWLYFGNALVFERYTTKPNAPEFIFTLDAELPLVADTFWIYLHDEYFFDFRSEQGEENDLAIGVRCNINDQLRLQLGWWHVDRIHDFDTDMFEVMYIYRF